MQLETVLETERLRLTNWLPEHLPDLMALHSDPRVTRYFAPDGAIEDKSRALERLADWAELFKTRRLGKLRMTDRKTGEFLGRAGYGIYSEEKLPEIGYALLPAHWGKGYASEAAVGLRDWLFEETDNDLIEGFAAIDNAASIRVLRKIGLIETGVGKLENGLVCRFHRLTREQWLV